MSWKDAFITVTFPKKVVLTLMSTLLLILHATVFIKDLYTFTVTQRVDRMNVDYTVVLLVSQVISFYWALLGSIYSLESENSVLSCLALGSLFLNFSVFIGRFALELMTIQYRAEKY